MLKRYAYENTQSENSVELQISKDDADKMDAAHPAGAWIFDHLQKKKIFVRWCSCGLDCFCAWEIVPQ